MNYLSQSTIPSPHTLLKTITFMSCRQTELVGAVLSLESDTLWVDPGEERDSIRFLAGHS